MQYFLLKCLLALLLLPDASNAIDGLELTVPPSPVNEGSTVIIQCTVTGLGIEGVKISRSHLDGSNTEILVINGRSAPNIPGNIDIRMTTDDVTGSHVFSVELVTVTRLDSMRYTCSAGTMLSSFQESGRLEVQYVPDANYPMCVMIVSGGGSGGSPQDLSRQSGDEVIVECLSQIGNPPVELSWTQTQASGATSPLSSRKEDKDSFTYATTIVTLRPLDDGVTFTCSLSNIQADRSCSIGPFTVSGNSGGTPADGINPTMVVAIVILIVVIAVVFLVVTIALIIKYGCCCCNRNRNNNGDDATDGLEMGVRKGKGRRRDTEDLNDEIVLSPVYYADADDYSDKSLQRKKNGHVASGTLSTVESDAYSNSSLKRKLNNRSRSGSTSSRDSDGSSTNSLKRNSRSLPPENYYPPPPTYPSDHPPEEPESDGEGYAYGDHIDGAHVEKLYPDLPNDDDLPDELPPESPVPSSQGMIPIEDAELSDVPMHVDATVTVE